MRKACFTIWLAFLWGCATVPPPEPISTKQIVEKDCEVGLQIAGRFESELKLGHDVDVSIYLRNLAQALVQNTELKDAPIGVLLVADRASGDWRDFSLPGNRIYLSTGLLRQLQFENEVAAAIAFELGHIVKRHALSRLAEQMGKKKAENPTLELVLPSEVTAYGQNIRYFGPGGVFGFTDEEQAESVQVAVDILYRAGFDPRGLVSLWDKYKDQPRRSPFDPGALAKLTEQTRQSIALYSPLRNPIVRSQAFIKIQERIRKL
jgi:beta-barrel assembly-enhancing protease